MTNKLELVVYALLQHNIPVLGFGIVLGVIIAVAALALAALAIASAPEPESPTRDPSEVSAPSTRHGSPVGIVFGTVWIEQPQLLWFGNVDAEAVWGKA